MTDDKATPADELAEAIERVGEQTQPNKWRNGVAAIRDTDGRLLLAALAAERDRADRAEAALEGAWDEGAAWGWNSSGVAYGDNPYRSEATA